ncbi:COG4223 family protein, partial [Rhizobiaceae sp. 2RAB30]
ELDGLNQKVASLQSAIDAASKTGTDMDGRLATVEQSIAGLSQKVEAQADQPRIALAIAASGLKGAVERGGAFSSELETFAAVAPNAPELPELRTLAEKGVPSRVDLVAAAPTAVAAMIDASRVIDVNAGFLDRLMTSAESLVKVRPVGVVEGEGVPEKSARMEAALKDGDLAKALAEYVTIPESAKAAGAPFADNMRNRLQVEQLVGK